MPIHLLDLPSEILVQILHSTDLQTLSACLATNRRVTSIIDDSILLQYRRAALAACVEDNPWNTSLTSAQKLFALQQRQTAFTELVPNSVRIIQMDGVLTIQDIYTYALSGGIFVVTEPNRKTLRWIDFAAVEHVWNRLEIDEHVHEFALAIPEHDLLAVLTSTSTLSPSLATTHRLRFYEMSTQSAHCGAQEPVITLPSIILDGPDFQVDVCGPKVMVLITDFRMFDVPATGLQPSRVMLYDWKQGLLQTDLSDMYSAAVFVSVDIILLARWQTGTLELWSTQMDVPARMTVSLKLPQLARFGTYHVIRIEYNPKGRGGPSSKQPFHSSFADSIIMLQIIVDPSDESFPDITNLFLFVPRRALLQLSSGRNDGEELTWRDWGPLNAKWMDGTGMLDEWPTIICGQRCVLAQATEEGARVTVLDFNPYTHRRTPIPEDEQEGDDGPSNKFVVSVVKNQFEHVEDLFAEEVDTQLGVVGVVLSRDSQYDGVLMDEEWIVGINDKRQSEGRFWLEVLNIG
ncbi:hypothetical protein B0H16DRAFT_1881091 [Mycena metata]|uniref:F-box domain-containing protein n=1 Tax=Mycena metata TaxID=1033252 RepID=A0AAD7NR03_9AGAR|nr:hypothetical protein B0H16DRAFT_1881091 [Mycena metata]